MSNPAYLPNVQPKNNATAQIRRRANDSVSAIVENQATATAQAATIQTLAPAVSPAFTGAVQQPALPTLTNAPIHTTANSGGASALPALPAGYTTIQVNGIAYKVALYPL
jgi:hypothetical protein